MNRLHKTLEAVWYAAGPAQYLMYAIWTVVISGMFHLHGSWQLLSTCWKMVGVVIFLATIWGTLAQKQYAILSGTILSLIVGAVYTSKAMMFSDADTIRAAMQSHYMAIFVMVFWGFYLANLCARQRMEFDRAGLTDE